MSKKKISAAILSAIMALSMVGCGSDSNSSGTESSSKEESSATQTTTESKAETTAATTSTAETQKPDAPVINGVKAQGNKVSVSFTLPENISGYYLVVGTKDEINTNNVKYGGQYTTVDDTERVINNLEYNTKYYALMQAYVTDGNNKITSDTAKPVAFVTGKKQTQTKKSQQSSGEVDPQFKATMDSYEQFFDEYVDFMNKYQNASAGELVSMMSDYSKFLTQYSEFMNKLNSIDKNSLNSAELAYYTKVMANITAKLAEIGQ